MTNTSADIGFLSPTTALPDDDQALAIDIQATVAGITLIDGTLVRPRWQPTPAKQPEWPINWCAVGVLSDEPEDNISLEHFGTGAGYSVSQENVVLNCMASFYGPSCGSYARLFRVGMMIAQNREAMSLINIALVETPGKASRVPELTSNSWVDRWDVPFRIRRKVSRSWNILNVLSVVGTAHEEQTSVPIKTP
jgi:hypothetical protein